MHAWRRLAITGLFAALVPSITGHSATAATPWFPHVRAVDSVAGALLARGYRRSPTFRDRVDAIEASDLIVHVEHRPLASSQGALHFVTKAGGFRYVRIVVHDGNVGDGAVALLGHELQHAVEVASAAWVVDLPTFLELYREIGRISCQEPKRCFDTVMAVNAGRRILSELRWPSRRDGVAVTETRHRADIVRR